MCARRGWAVLAALLSCASFASGVPQDAETRAERSFSLVAFIGGGYSRYITASGGPPPGVAVDFGRSGVAGTARVMWYPNHLIRVGFETGWTSLYSYDFGSEHKGQVYVSAIPLIPVWSMNVLDIDLFAGAGYYLLHSRLDYRGQVTARTWSLGWLAAASYRHPLWDNWGVAGEIKWLNVAEHQDAVFTFQVQMVWKFLEW